MAAKKTDGNKASKNKTKEIKLPKFLKLNKGLMWFDTIGENCSNVHLYNIKKEFVGRGYISDNDWHNYQEQGTLPDNDIAVDSNKNASSEHGAYGHVDVEEDRSYFDVSKIDNAKLGNIITAFNNNILIEFDPDKVVEEEPRVEKKRNFSFKKNSQNGTDGDIVFTGTNKRMYDKLNNSNHSDLIKFIQASGTAAKSNLMDLYDYELSGYNRLNRPRASVLDALKAKLNSLAPGMSGITVEEFDGDDK